MSWLVRDIIVQTNIIQSLHSKEGLLHYTCRTPISMTKLPPRSQQ